MYIIMNICICVLFCAVSLSVHMYIVSIVKYPTVRFNFPVFNDEFKAYLSTVYFEIVITLRSATSLPL